VIGQYVGQYVGSAVASSYAGIAPRFRSGRYDIESLRPGEWIVEPGLIY
jgi:hypothetical protein